jgi:glyoxylase-like metal-dependent hydrolase (beta-lactamase superfamily II)
MTENGMQLDGYDIDVIVQGYPGKSVCHGGLGWSTIVLLRGHGRVALVDVGGFNIRVSLAERLKHRGLKPSDVTDLLLTHAHHDHCLNWPLFSHARIVLGKQEMEWAATVPWGIGPVPELYVEKLQGWKTVYAATDGEEVMPGITAHIMPGHTPGHLLYRLKGSRHDVIFTGDAAKNRAEMLSGRADGTYDQAVSQASIASIWTLWRERPGNVLIPGHDIPMVLKDGRPEYLAKREAAIKAWFGDDLDQMTTIELTVR